MNGQGMPEPLKNYTYYISLDLGSESTAAYFEKRHARRGKLINLQAYAFALLEGKNPNYLKDASGGNSRRLRTRFGLRDFAQPEILGNDHALLDFVDKRGNVLYINQNNVRRLNYSSAIFEYFLEQDSAFSLTGKNMPNPKIPFQMGGADVIPRLAVKEQPGQTQDLETQHGPGVLIQHMIVQMLRNFVLRSPELRSIKEEDLKDVHLTLTVPNVYSLTHVEAIKQSVEDLMDFEEGAVAVLYESDALAYFFLRPPEVTDSADFQAISRKMTSVQDNCHIITFDVGRGTTDLSLIQIDSIHTPEGKEPRHRAVARTGCSDGGNKLNYIFAKYFYNQMRINQKLIFSNYANVNIPFDFLNTINPEGLMESEQAQAIGALEQLIEEVKRSMTTSYEVLLPQSQQATYIKTIIDFLFRAIGKEWEKDNKEAAKLREVLQEAFLLPVKPPSTSIMGTFTKRRSKKPETDPLKQLALELKKETLQTLTLKMQGYVEDIVGLFEELEDIAKAMQDEEKQALHSKAKARPATSAAAPAAANPKGRQDSIRGDIYDPERTFVLIGGQASQFKPLREALERECRHLGFQDRYCFLKNDEAKEACSRGAILFRASRHLFVNPKELHGFYGFIRRAGIGGIFHPVPMASIRQGGAVTIQVDFKGDYFFVYSTRPDLAEKEMTLGDSSMAIIGTFPARRRKAHETPGHYFDIRYDMSDLALFINGERIHEIGSFGAQESSIFPKIWPELLQPK